MFAFAIGATLIGGLLAVIGWWIDPAAWWGAYLAGWLYWAGLSLGSLSLLMLHNLTGGAWGHLVRKWLHAAAAPLPLMLLVFLPVVLAPERLYEWADPSRVRHDSILQHKARYLNADFWRLRAAVYFAVWLGLWGMLRWQERRNSPPGSRSDLRFRRLSAQGLALHGLVITFASIDWMMSLEPRWFSTIYGIIVFSSTGLAALAAVIIGVAGTACRGVAGGAPAAAPQPPLELIPVGATPTNTRTQDLTSTAPEFAGTLHDLGKLLFTFLLFWAYVSFSQYFIIWHGNLPEEVVWYVRRLRGTWGVLAGLLVVLHFVVPFALLLGRNWKLNPARVSVVAALILGMHWVETIWLIAPAAAKFSVAAPLWLYAGLTLAIGGPWLLICDRAQHRLRPVPAELEMLRTPASRVPPH